MRPELKNFKGFTLKNLPEYEGFAQGHRACQGCGTVLPLRLALKALGPNTIAVTATGCMEIVSSPFPYTSWNVPWIHVAFENSATVASGIEAAIKALKRKGKLKSKEKINVVVFAGDGATFDIGLQWLSGALERGHDFIYICLDNEAYMNTGVQRSGATPFGAHTTTSPAGKVVKGQTTWKKNLMGIVVAHNIPYAATANPAFPIDLMNKVKKAALINGPAFIHVYATCPTGWGTKSEDSLLVAKLAVETRVFPLYEVIDGKYIINRKVDKPKPVEEYLKLQRRFRHLTPEQIAYIQERVNQEYEKLLKLAECFGEPQTEQKEE
ncbi:pyruvate synthase subunit PorB [Thermodesulfobacterium commune]|jgi:pyruvate ferredoxin oxidoreductase beta subunit|uniref:Pyruvate ferredoxin oxidoreductase n=1 Tax=Thermodesulfobacterium commune DSM 2178 TaxID=289377 RepID=A0A075WYJ9_9BACT|nr:pyruvate synthase subunit PorB [Thermodesulfobacterium commune]AIH03707.1 pyruvate ferredoxin oxidoreductase [Thermodesulfobacterium commune DSM 2178]